MLNVAHPISSDMISVISVAPARIENTTEAIAIVDSCRVAKRTYACRKQREGRQEEWRAINAIVALVRPPLGRARFFGSGTSLAAQQE